MSADLVVVPAADLDVSYIGVPALVTVPQGGTVTGGISDVEHLAAGAHVPLVGRGCLVLPGDRVRVWVGGRELLLHPSSLVMVDPSPTAVEAAAEPPASPVQSERDRQREQ